jgi:hypothetical protein
LRSQNDVVGDQDDVTLWSVRSVGRPKEAASIPVGNRTPEGFELVEPLRELRTGEATLLAEWDGDLQHALKFRYSEVPDDGSLILSDDGVIPVSEFLEAARARCG